MLTKEDLITEAKRLGFADIGFTNAEPFASQAGKVSSGQYRQGKRRNHPGDSRIRKQDTQPLNTSLMPAIYPIF
jgi:hypothetical protein